MVTLAASSCNVTLVPNANVTFGGTGTDRTVTIITAPGSTIQTATVTVTASGRHRSDCPPDRRGGRHDDGLDAHGERQRPI